MKIAVYCAYGVVINSDYRTAEEMLAELGSIDNLRAEMKAMDTVFKNFKNIDDFVVTYQGNEIYINPQHIIAVDVDMKDVQELLDKHDEVV